MVEIEKIWKLDKLLIKLNAPKLENKVSFYRLMAVTQKAGLGVREALNSINRSETHWGMKRILLDIIEQINQWVDLATAMTNHDYFFGTEEIELVRSAESMWNLPDVLENLADELENIQRLRSKLKNAMIYPAVIIVFAIAAVIILLIKVMPTITSLFPSKEDLPWITKFMLSASDFLQKYWWLLIVWVVGSVFWYKILYSRFLPFKIIMDKFFLRIPMIGDIVRKFNHYRFSKLLGDFYNAWVNPTVALQQISEILKNYHYRKKVENIKNDLEVWLGFTESMEGSRLFDQILIQIIWVWESTWNIWEVLVKIAVFYREEVDNKTEGLTKVIEPILMWFVALIIWIIVASVFLPMADLIGNIWGR